MKQCYECKEVQDESNFSKCKRCCDGLQTKCKDCVKAYNKANREHRAVISRVYRTNNKDTISEKNRVYKQKNKSKTNAATRKRQAAKLQRTPSWLTEHDYYIMEGFYILAECCAEMFGVPYHVDHEQPLQGKCVSGLHVPENLRVITAAENLSKGNR